MRNTFEPSMIAISHSVTVALTISETGARRAIEIGMYRLRFIHQRAERLKSAGSPAAAGHVLAQMLV